MPPDALTTVNIMLVDDRPENLLALEAVLSHPGYKLIKAPSGEQALRLLLQEDFAAILLDIQMPGLDGFETAMLIKKREKSQRIPILFITANHQDELNSKRGYEIGGVDYIFKPFDPKALRTKVEVFVQLYRMRVQAQERAEECSDGDFTEREHRLAELEVETQARFERLAEAIPQIVFMAGADGNIEYFNQRWYDFTGLTSALSQSLGWQAALHPDDLHRTREAWAEADSPGKKPFEIEHRFRRRDGAVHWHLTRASALRDSEGVIVNWFGTSTDIERQKQAERELKNSQAQLQVAMDAAYMATWEWNQSSDEIVHSENFDRLFGLPPIFPPRPEWSRFLQKVHPDDRESVRLRMREAVSLNTRFSVEFRVIWPDGSQHWLAARGRANTSESNHLAGIAGAVINIDVLKKTEFLLQDAVRAREEILAVVSHDLKNPLSAIQLNAQMAQRFKLPERNERLENNLARILSSAKRAISLIHDLLDLAQIEAGHLPIEPVDADLVELVRQEVQLLEPTATMKGLKITADLPSPRLQLRCDPKRILQVLSNLLGNAIKFTPSGGQISISLAEYPDEVRLTVRDSGPGINEEHLRRLFDRYWQARYPTGTSPSQGVGLGLYIAKGIVEGHGGSIQVESEPGKGAVFKVSLPRRKHQSAA